jgi:hypothetical protein
MSQNPIVADTKRKLADLEQRIRAARASPGAHHEITGEAQKDWDDMVASHAAIARKLEATGDHPAEVLEGIRLDIDVLRHSFERWMARVEGNSAQDGGRKGGGGQ